MLLPTQAKPTLEGIPTELLILILFQIPDRASLKSIVHSSPICHQAYLAVRQEVLCCVLKTQYGGNGALLDLSEAITAVRSEGLPFQSHKEEAIALLDKWRRKNEINALSQTLTPSPPIYEPGSLRETIKLFRLYEKLYFFLEDYATHMPRPTWIQPGQWHDDMLPIELSCTEKRRFLRALCRLQILANIFGLPESDINFSNKNKVWYVSYKDNDWYLSRSGEYEAYRLFFGTMPPWEYEEMGCVWSYLMTKYEPVVKEVSDELRKLVSNTGCFRFCEIVPEDQRPPLGCQMEIISNLDTFERCFDELVAMGPLFLYRILHAEHLLRRNMILANVRRLDMHLFIGRHLELSWDERFPLIHPADRHETLNFEQLWSELPPIEQPNFGWKKAWLAPHTAEQDLEDTLNYDREDETDWEWGYAIWDAERLEKWNAPLEQPERT